MFASQEKIKFCFCLLILLQEKNEPEATLNVWAEFNNN